MPPLQLNYFNIFVKQKKNDGATGWQVISSGFFSHAYSKFSEQNSSKNLKEWIISARCGGSYL